MNKTTGGNSLLDAAFVLKKARLGERMKVADLGCGASGHFVFPAGKIVGKYGRVYAVDILKAVLENIKKRIDLENIDNIETVWSDLEIFGATKINSGSLDVALLINTLYLSGQRGQILREAVRMIKKDGYLLIVEWKNISLPFGPRPEERVSVDNLKAAAGKLGLKLEEEFEAGQYHYGLLFMKI